MKKAFYLLLSTMIVFSSCMEKEQTPKPDVGLFCLEDGTASVNYSFKEYERLFDITVSIPVSTEELTLEFTGDGTGWVEMAEQNYKSVHLRFHVKENGGSEARNGTVKLLHDEGEIIMNISQIGKFQEGSVWLALKALYDGCDGENWQVDNSKSTIPTNDWFSDTPFFTWHGVLVKDAYTLFDFGDSSKKVYYGTEDEIGLVLSNHFLQFARGAFFNNVPRITGIKGEIPENFWTIADMFYILNLTGERDEFFNVSADIPSSIFNKRLQELTVYHNGNEGCEKISIHLTKDLLKNCENLKILDIYVGHGVSGEFPDFSCCKKLQKIHINTSGEVSGSLPADMSDLKDLLVLSVCLGSNGHKFCGEIPESLYELTELKEVAFFGTGMSGTISPKVANLVNLYDFSISCNRFSGVVPESLGALPQIRYVLTYGNQFTSYPEFYRYRDLLPLEWGKYWSNEAHQINPETGKDVFLPMPGWWAKRTNLPKWSGFSDYLLPETCDLQYPQSEYYWDGEYWRHPKYEHPARDYWKNHDGEWVYEPGNPWSTYYNTDNGYPYENPIDMSIL